MTASQTLAPSTTKCFGSLILFYTWIVLLTIPVQAETGSVAPSPNPASNQETKDDKDEFWWASKFDMVRYINRASATIYFKNDPVGDKINPYYVFLPPVPPPLGVDYPLLGTPLPGGPPPPSELAAFAHELFYPQIGARLSGNDLPKELWQKIQAYRTEKTKLQDELRSRIAEYKDTESQTRERHLAEYAAAQTPQIILLEVTAEKIRTELQTAGLIEYLTNSAAVKLETEWSRPAVQNETPALHELRVESEVLRHAAFLEKGLTLAQRHLLREMAIELESRSTSLANKAGPENRLLYFSPESARITLPTLLPEPLENLIKQYVSTKNSLKAELQTALLDHEMDKESRAQVLKRLGDTQAASFAALEVLAEKIRQELSSQPNPTGPPAPPALPPLLMEQIATYRLHKVEALRTLHGLLAGVRGSSASKNTPPSKPLSLQESIADFNHRQSVLIAQLNQERLGIRTALSEYVRTTGRPDDRKSVDDLLKDFENARQKQELWDKYRDYQSAVLLPGLSPEQRRLLFDAAVEQLKLPLPYGWKAP